ncbi:unnamed protein product [Mytilus edulis]|uniref:RNA helicase n=1 Tax=Mytilus edulis TaxID=6550 RepID=A0A8S3Q460_MYTED|nr:unnamed protein product [Mytilus edulis]
MTSINIAQYKIRSTERQHDPVEGILLKAIKNVESVFTNRKVTSFLMQDSLETRTLLSALESAPLDKRVTRYVQWISETKRKTESVMLKDADVPRLIHICLRHLELYVECLEMNSLLEIDNVTELLTDAYGLFSCHNTSTEIRHSVESNPDVNEIIKTLLQEYEILNEDSRFLVFVKTRASAKALAKRLPHCLKSYPFDGEQNQRIKQVYILMNNLRLWEDLEKENICVSLQLLLHEGLDIPQCNLMIRYKFRVDEISSYQMRAERGIYASEVQGRLLQQRQADSKTIGAFTVNCKFCGKPVADGQFIRNIKRKHTIIFDKTILTRIRREPFKKITKFDTIKKTERVFGNICGHNWGVILVYQQCDFVAISKDKVNFFDKFSKDLVKFKKWPEFPYRIDDVSDEEVQRYLSQ